MDGPGIRDQIAIESEPAGTRVLVRLGLMLLILAAVAWWALRRGAKLVLSRPRSGWSASRSANADRAST